VTQTLFTLVPGRWYAAELIGDDFGEALRSYSPIRVDGIKPLGTGTGELLLEFFHANYPQGVQAKSYRLQMVERQTRFLLGRSLGHTPTRLLLVYEPTWEWLNEHFGLSAERLGLDIQTYMDQLGR
jgi:hypothetical protein